MQTISTEWKNEKKGKKKKKRKKRERNKVRKIDGGTIEGRKSAAFDSKSLILSAGSSVDTEFPG